MIGERFAHAARASKVSARSLVKRRRKNKWTNPFVFIVGCPRSGTTLLQRILDAHPDIAICDETFWVVYYFKKKIGLTPEGLITPELITQLLEYYKFHRMKIGREDLVRLLGDGQPVHYSSFVSRIFDHYGEIKGKPLVGDKTPDYARNLPTLHALWPKTKFVHLIRDGRDVCLSAINWKRKAAKLASIYSTWREHPVATAAAWWEWHLCLGRQAGRLLGPALYYELRYEALVSHPAEELAKLSRFLAVPYDEAMLHFHEGRTKADPGLGAKDAWRPITPALRDWRGDMLAEDVERFEAVSGDLLDELGYARGVPRPGWQARQYAAPIREAFRRDAQALGDWLP